MCATAAGPSAALCRRREADSGQIGRQSRAALRRKPSAPGLLRKIAAVPSDRLVRRAYPGSMFDPAAALARLNLLLALVAQLFAAFSRLTRQAVRCLERAEHALAGAVRATLAEAGIAFPDLDDVGLVAWFAARDRTLKTSPASDGGETPRSALKPPANPTRPTALAPPSAAAGAAALTRRLENTDRSVLALTKL
jgi:hypothetical protein